MRRTIGTPDRRKPESRGSGRASAAQRQLVPADAIEGDDQRRRAMLADYIRLLAWWLGRPPVPALPPRLDQTLRALLAGDAEKQVAARLGVSIHTAHDHVKELYRRLGVTSRGELLSRFLPTLGVPSIPADRPANPAPRRTPRNR